MGVKKRYGRQKIAGYYTKQVALTKIVINQYLQDKCLQWFKEDIMKEQCLATDFERRSEENLVASSTQIISDTPYFAACWHQVVPNGFAKFLQETTCHVTVKLVQKAHSNIEHFTFNFVFLFIFNLCNHQLLPKEH